MSINVQEVLVEGERVLGRYQVEILAPGSYGWSPAVMAIEALITNFRLLLKPFKRKYQHASLPNYYFTSVEKNEINGYPCVSISIRTGHSLHLVLPRRHTDALIDDLATMRIPKPKFRMDENVAQDDIRRLVAFLQRWEPNPSV